MPIFRIAGVILEPLASSGGAFLGGLLVLAIVVVGFFDLIGIDILGGVGKLNESSVRLSSLQFYESSRDDIPENKRNYGTVFASSKTRYIHFVSKFNFTMPVDESNLNLKIVWRKSDGTVVGQQETEITGLRYKNNFSTHAAWGSDSFGSWKKGDYTLTFVANERTLGSGSFSVK